MRSQDPNHNMGDLTKPGSIQQPETPSEQPAQRRGVFKFTAGGVVLPPNLTDLTMAAPAPAEELFDQSPFPAEERFGGLFADAINQLRLINETREVNKIPELANFIQTVALESNDPALEREAIAALSLKQHFLADPRFSPNRFDPGVFERGWNTVIDFRPLARRYFLRMVDDYHSGLAAAELLRHGYGARVSMRASISARIGRHGVIRNQAGGRGHDLHPFSKGLLCSGEVTAVRIACDEMARSIGGQYANPRPLCWLLWKLNDTFWASLKASYPRLSDNRRDNMRLAYHLCKKLPSWPINIPRIIEHTIDRRGLPPLLNDLSSWRTERA